MDDTDHGDRLAVEAAAIAAEGRGTGRARLRLVEREAVELGPISPELVLVCPELAEAAGKALPDPRWSPPRPVATAPRAERPDPAAASRPSWRETAGQEVRAESPEPPLEPAEGDRGPILFDTADLRLGLHDISLARRVRSGSRSWKLVLPRGEVVEVPEQAGTGEPPAEIAALIRTIAGEERLLPVPWHSDDVDFARLQAQVWEHRDALLRHDPGTRLGVDPENLHQFRVASRRLRAFLRVGRRLVDDEWSAFLRSELGDLGRAAGPARDLDVLLEQLRGEVESLDPHERPAGEALISALEAQRELVQQELLRTLNAPAYLRLLDRLALPIQAAVLPAQVSLRRHAARELERLVKDVRKLGGSPDDASLHGLRIRVKRVRYAVELGGEPARAQTERVIRAAKTLQDLLGEHQDTLVAEKVLGELAGLSSNSPLAFVAGRLAERQRLRREGLKQRLPRAWRQLRRAARKSS